MSADEFRRRGTEVVHWIANYMESVGEFPVQSPAEPGSVLAALPTAAPEHGEPFEDMLADVDRVVMPGITHWQSPRFFAYFPSNASGPSILGDLLSSGLGVQGMLWSTSPTCTELEIRMLDWMAEALGLPERFRSTSRGGGVIQDTASSATLCAIAAARDRSAASIEKLVAYASDEAHSSVEKSLRIAGIPSDRLRRIDTDAQGAMCGNTLATTMDEDVKRDLVPFLVVATCGTTGTGAFDSIAACAHAASGHDAWLHVDAAMFGTASICEEYRWIHDGIEHADSYCVNPHKWMLTNFDCTCFFVADREPLLAALSIMPEYLRNSATDSGGVIDFRDWQVPLGRRFRALKLWFVLRWHGLEGIRAMIRNHVAMAQTFAAAISEDDRFEIAAPHPLNLVCFRAAAGDETTRRLVSTINTSGRAMLTHCSIDGQFVVRCCIGHATTTMRDVDELIAMLREEVDQCLE